MNKVWVLHGRTESDDPIGPHAFAHKLTRDEQATFLRDNYREEWDYTEGDISYSFGETEVLP